jgi:putative ABC transport system permease protein
LDTLSFVDVNTLRTLTGLTAVRPYTSSEHAKVTVEVDEEGLFAGVDALFSDSVVSDTATTSRDTAIDFENLLGDTSVRDRYLALDNNAWYFLLLDVADGASLADVGRNAGAAGNDLVIETWRWGAGFIAELAYGIRNILNVIILVVSIVAIIIIMNTLVISVTERMAEIGTVRAIGGQRNFVRSMITVEVLMITLIFGLIGMVIGSAVIGLLSLAGLSASNLFLQVLFGGSVLKPALSVGSLFTSTAVVAIIGVVASLYPVSVALGIAPVQAMQKR